MRFRTVGLIAMAMAIAAVAAPPETQAATVETVQPLAKHAEYAATNTAAPIVLTVQYLSADSGLVIARLDTARMLALRSLAPQVVGVVITAPPGAVKNRTRPQPAPDSATALPAFTSNTSTWRSASNRMRFTRSATGDSLSARSVGDSTGRQRPTTRQQN